MTVRDLFARVGAALDTVGIPYMVVGSFASSAHGIPRATRDIDIVIAPTKEQLPLLIERFPSSHYHAVLEEALFAFEHRSLFNVTDYSTGWRIDFIIRSVLRIQRPASGIRDDRYGRPRTPSDVAQLSVLRATIYPLCCRSGAVRSTQRASRSRDDRIRNRSARSTTSQPRARPREVAQG